MMLTNCVSLSSDSLIMIIFLLWRVSTIVATTLPPVGGQLPCQPLPNVLPEGARGSGQAGKHDNDDGQAQRNVEEHASLGERAGSTALRR